MTTQHNYKISISFVSFAIEIEIFLHGKHASNDRTDGLCTVLDGQKLTIRNVLFTDMHIKKIKKRRSLLSNRYHVLCTYTVSGVHFMTQDKPIQRIKKAIIIVCWCRQWMAA